MARRSGARGMSKNQVERSEARKKPTKEQADFFLDFLRFSSFSLDVACSGLSSDCSDSLHMRACKQRCSPRYSTSWPGPCSSSSSSRSRPLPLQTRARSALSSTSSSSSSSPPRVYLQVTPLEGLSFLDSGPAELSPHAVVVLEIGSDVRIEKEQQRQVFAFDFLPREPKQLSTALALFSGRAVEATGRERRLSRVPKRRCVLVCCEGGEATSKGSSGSGSSSTSSSAEEEEATAAAENNTSLLAVARARLRAWEDTPLVWRRFDCTHAAVELAAELAGVEESAARRALERACSSS